MSDKELTVETKEFLFIKSYEIREKVEDVYKRRSKISSPHVNPQVDETSVSLIT